MANLQIKNLPEGLHEELRRRASISHKTIRGLPRLVDGAVFAGLGEAVGLAVLRHRD